MGWNGFIPVIFLLSMINDVSGIDPFRYNIRKLAALGPPNNSSPAQAPPFPSPVPNTEKQDSTLSDNSIEHSSEDVANDPASSDASALNLTAPVTPQTSEMNAETHGGKMDNGTEPSPSQRENSDNKSSPPQGKDTEKNGSPPQGKEDDNKSRAPKPETQKKTNPPPNPKEADKKQGPPPEAMDVDKKMNPSPETKVTDKKLSPPTGALESCDEKEKRCRVQNKFTGCIWDFNPDSKELEILVQNDAQEDLMVNFIVPTSGKEEKKVVPVPKHQTTKVNISNIIGKASKIVLKTGNMECDIAIASPLPEGSFFFRLPTTEELLTPVNGAYFLLIAVITFGGVWACCNFTKRRRHGSVPYQEIEMASPETAAGAVETAEGWDQDWDDDWDEENSTKSPVTRLHTGSISANGLTSRTANRDGWENDWDD